MCLCEYVIVSSRRLLGLNREMMVSLSSLKVKCKDSSLLVPSDKQCLWGLVSKLRNMQLCDRCIQMLMGCNSHKLTLFRLALSCWLNLYLYYVSIMFVYVACFNPLKKR